MVFKNQAEARDTQQAQLSKIIEEGEADIKIELEKVVYKVEKDASAGV